jgi:hypothetical protein
MVSSQLSAVMEGEGAWIIKHNKYSKKSGNIYNVLNPETN